jgi:ribosomal protein S18 acetylase RimI-like enzyme
VADRDAIFFRAMREGDIPVAIELWCRAGITLGLSDRPDELRQLLAHNPRTCIVGTLPHDDKLVATALGTFDGRRANLWHLAVDPEQQGRGFGKAIMAELERIWLEMKVVKVTMFTAEVSNAQVARFYTGLGYQVRDDIFAISKILR